MNWLKENRRSWQPAAVAVFTFGLLLPLGEMIRLHPYQYTHFNHIAGTVRTGRQFVHAGLLGPGAEAGLRRPARGTGRAAGSRRRSGRKWKVAVCGPQRPAQVALGPDFTIGWDSNAADFAMTLGEFYCKGLTAPVHGGDQARRRGVRARLRHPRPQHFQPCWRFRRRRRRHAAVQMA